MSSDNGMKYNSDSEAESELDDDRHNKLIENVLNLNKKPKIYKPTRTEPSLEISEFNLVKSGTGKKGLVKLKDLTKTLKNSSKHVSLGQQVEAFGRMTKTLSKPLEKPQTDRIRRTIAYEETKKQLNRWDPIVTANRAASTLRFPLNDDELKIDTKAKASDLFNWRKTKLQLALEKVTPPEVETIEVNTEAPEFSLTMAEMLERRRETAKLRAVQNYKEVKARRQNKIKSKKFHRIERKAKAKQQLKDFEDLQKINPEAALVKLEELEKARAQERVSLRHKSTGQWAKNKQIRAKYDKESRQVLAEQLAISRDLTQKLKKTDSDSECDDNDLKQAMSSVNVDPNNPWTGNAKIKPNEEVSSFVTSLKNFSTEQMKLDKTDTVVSNSQANPSKKEVQLKLQYISVNKSLASEKKQEPVESLSNDRIEVKKSKKQKRKRTQVSLESVDIKHVQNTNKKKKHLIPPVAVKDVKKIKSNQLQNIHIEESTGSLWIVSSMSDDKSPSNNGIDDIFNDLDKKLEEKVQHKLYDLIKTKNKVSTQKVKRASKGKERKLKTVKSNFEMLELKDERRRLRSRDGLNEGGELEDEIQLLDLKRLEDVLGKAQSVKKSEEIDPNKFMNMVPVKLNTKLPDVLVNEGDENDDSGAEESFRKDQKEVISEAFCDDDIVHDFNRDKQSEIDKNTPKDVDLTMPGWGSWGGRNLKVPKWKRRRFILKAPKAEVRRDSNRGNLVINEVANNAKLAKHRVSDVPFPYKDVKEFEISLKTPIDGTFIPQTAFRKFIEPSVITKMGTIIEPMTEDILLKKKSTVY